jgi:RND family efflux transporter MFP subunit
MVFMFLNLKSFIQQLIYKKRLLAIIGAITLLIFSLLILNIFRPQVTVEAGKEKVWTVDIEVAKLGDYAPEVVLYGVTETPGYAILESTITGDVIATPVLEGESIQQGQLLVQLDDREEKLVVQQRQAEVNELQAQIESEKQHFIRDQQALALEKQLVALSAREVERQVHLSAKNLSAKSAVDQAKKILQEQQLAETNRQLAIKDHPNRMRQLQAKLSKAEAVLADAQLDLQRTQIYAPFSGRVSKLKVALGMRVQAGEVLVEVYDTSKIEVRAQIPLKYLASIKQGLQKQQALLAQTTLDDAQINLRLVRLASLVEQQRGGVDAIFQVQSDTPIALGRTLEIILTLPTEKQVFEFSANALYANQYVYIISDEKRLKKIPVKKIGYINQQGAQGQVIVRSQQLKEGDKIVITKLPNIRSNLLVDIHNSHESKP